MFYRFSTDKLKEVCIRLAEGHPLYSDVPLSYPGAVLQVMRKEMSQLDRECLCVVNLNTKLQPINFNIISVGELNQSIAAIPNILKSGLMSMRVPSSCFITIRPEIQLLRRQI